MRMFDKIKKAIFTEVPEAFRENTFDSVIKNIELLAKDSPELKAVAKEFRSGKLTQEQYVATSIAIITQELLEFREERVKAELQAW
ncbi:hypothetical protein EGH67_15455 [Klebsiella aerogenes]|nr:hypothetical protein [Klebsiella aerogenes]EUL55879.1 hypothetical protein P848_02540 [Klebsiella aerogenes UCI 45]EUL75709.1 hypothetical protein P831_04285 [Klebsiella aerogenes UCI 28]EUL83245.1 hypothetical protein P830_02260 [Klebsiella aerogenes UCI 27]ELA2524414.1 hypothetical protein [Klebsiella aerogenes]